MMMMIAITWDTIKLEMIIQGEDLDCLNDIIANV